MKKKMKKTLVCFSVILAFLGSSMNVYAREYVISYGNIELEQPEGVTSVNSSDGTAISYQYDQNGNIVVKQEISSWSSSVTYYEYNSEGKLLKETIIDDDYTKWIQYEYSNNMTITYTTNSYHPDKVTTNMYIYDTMGNLIQEQEVSPYSATVTDYIYDTNGNLLQKYQDGYLECTYTYDVYGRRTSETRPDDNYNPTHRYFYDNNNNVIKIESNYRCTTLNYNQYGDIIQEICSGIELSADGGDYKMIYNYSYAYDDFGRIVWIEKKLEGANYSEYSITYTY